MKMVFVVGFVLYLLGALSAWVLLGWQYRRKLAQNCSDCQWMDRVIGDIRQVDLRTDRRQDYFCKQCLNEPAAPVVEEDSKATTNDVDIDGLILTESGGDAQAVGDQGRSKGLCQISRGAWEDVVQWEGQYGVVKRYPYDDNWKNPEVNRMVAGFYINQVIPEKYLKPWSIPDSVDVRLAMYKCGPQRFRGIWCGWREDWKGGVPNRVTRDLDKYHEYVDGKSSEKTLQP